MERDEVDIVIVGGGLSGLCCAREIQQRGGRFVLLESSERIGGRIRTDVVDGFLLDRGFQVLLTSYPEVRRVLDLDQLQLRSFLPGAYVRYDGRFHELTDPWRRPFAAVKSLWSPIGNFSDKLRVAKLRRDTLRGTLAERWNDPETSTLELLRSYGFSSSMIDRFFKPFLGGIFLDPNLATSSRMLRFVFRMFSTGTASLPAEGMEAIPRQIASMLPKHCVRTESRVVTINPGSDGNLSNVVLSTGEVISAKAIVVATEGPSAAALLGGKIHSAGQHVTCMYFAAPRSPIDQSILVLNGDSEGPINNLCVPTDIAPTYASAINRNDASSVPLASAKSTLANSFPHLQNGKTVASSDRNRSLISVTSLDTPNDDEQLRSDVVTQLTQWFGSTVADWKHLRTYKIPYALPTQLPPALSNPERPVRWQSGVYVCGDHRDNASIQGAMVSGYRAAEAVMQDLAKISC